MNGSLLWNFQKDTSRRALMSEGVVIAPAIGGRSGGHVKRLRWPRDPVQQSKTGVKLVIPRAPVDPRSATF
jgi:hypothetical protein